jgi:hypothetical protein
MHHHMPPSKPGWPSLNLLISAPVMRLVQRNQNSDHPRIIDKIYDLMLEDIRPDFGLNQYLRDWASHVSGLGQSFKNIWTCETSPWSGSRNAWTWIENLDASRLNIWNLFRSARSKWFPVAIGDHGRNLVISLWIGDKATVNGVAA